MLVTYPQRVAGSIPPKPSLSKASSPEPKAPGSSHVLAVFINPAKPLTLKVPPCASLVTNVGASLAFCPVVRTLGPRRAHSTPPHPTSSAAPTTYTLTPPHLSPKPPPTPAHLTPPHLLSCTHNIHPHTPSHGPQHLLT
ncbi:unnamed protein product [Boreogadus saida]